MTPHYLRALQAAILADADLVRLAVTPDMGKVEGGAYAQDKAIADALCAARWFGPGESPSRSILVSEARAVLLTHGHWRAITRKAAEDGDTPAHEAAWNAVELAKSDSARFDAHLPRSAALLGVLVQAGLCSAEAQAELMALCTNESTVTAEAVSRALRGPWGDEQT